MNPDRCRICGRYETWYRLVTIGHHYSKFGKSHKPYSTQKAHKKCSNKVGVDIAWNPKSLNHHYWWWHHQENDAMDRLGIKRTKK